MAFLSVIGEIISDTFRSLLGGVLVSFGIRVMTKHNPNDDLGTGFVAIVIITLGIVFIVREVGRARGEREHRLTSNDAVHG